MKRRHSIYYKYNAKTCVGLHFGFLMLNGLVLGGGTIAALWISMFQENLGYFALAMFCFLFYRMMRRVPMAVLADVLYTDCDVVKMNDILSMIENRAKVEQAKMIWRLLRVQAVSFIRGREQESYELLQTCKDYKMPTGYELFCLSLYMRHYSFTKEWENYEETKEKLYNLIMAQKPSSQKGMSKEQYMKGIEAGEKYRAGKVEEARKLYQELLDEKKSNMLNKVLIHERLAVMDMEEGKYESAKQHLMFAAQNGGTTYMAEEAETKLHQLEQE